MYYDPFILQIKDFLKSEKDELNKRGGLSKIDSLTNEDLNDYLVNLYDFPELGYYVLKNEDDTNDLFLRYRSEYTSIEIGRTTYSAYEDYENNKYNSCIKKAMMLLKKTDSPKSEIFALAGLSLIGEEKEEDANDYLRVSNYLAGEKNYNIINIDKIKERVEKEMKKGKNNNYNQFNYKSDKNVSIDMLSIPNFDEIIGYMEKNQLDIETAGKELKLSNEQIDLIKLIFAREFYKQGDIEKGNFYLNSVEQTRGKTSEVMRLCLETRNNKKFFQYREDNKPRHLSLIKPGKRK